MYIGGNTKRVMIHPKDEIMKYEEVSREDARKKYFALSQAICRSDDEELKEALRKKRPRYYQPRKNK